MKILIADDHKIIRVALCHMLAAEFRDATFGEAKTAQEALDLVWQQEWSVLILDITMPGRSGLDILGDIRKARPKLPVLVYTANAEELFATRVLKAGAAGYLTKAAEPSEVIHAFRQVLLGKNYITPAVAHQLVHNLIDNSPSPHEALSTREFEVFRQLAGGRSLKEIAANAALSVKTISTYRARVLEKLHAHSNADLVRYALERKLID